MKKIRVGLGLVCALAFCSGLISTHAQTGGFAVTKRGACYKVLQTKHSTFQGLNSKEYAATKIKSRVMKL